MHENFIFASVIIRGYSQFDWLFIIHCVLITNLLFILIIRYQWFQFIIHLSMLDIIETLFIIKCDWYPHSIYEQATLSVPINDEIRFSNDVPLSLVGLYLCIIITDAAYIYITISLIKSMYFLFIPCWWKLWNTLTAHKIINSPKLRQIPRSIPSHTSISSI